MKVPERKKIMVTGATGLVGGHVTHHLCQNGKSVYCLVKKGCCADYISDLPVTLLDGDITDQEGLKKLFSGMDAVIHCAAKVADWGQYEDFYRTNVIGTLNVLEACRQNDIRKVIITGSVSSYGEEDSRILKDETFPFRSHYPYALHRWLPSGMNNYRDTKAEATRQAMAFARKNDIDLVVIEPVWVYGENEFSSGFHEYLKIARSGFPVMPGSESNTFHVIYAGELARAYFLALEKELPGVHRVIIGNEKPENMSHIYSLLCKEAGCKKPKRLPKWLLYPFALIMEGIYLVGRIATPPTLTRSRVNMFYDSIGFSTLKAKELIGFRNQVSIETGIRNTVQWYLKNKKI